MAHGTLLKATMGFSMRSMTSSTLAPLLRVAPMSIRDKMHIEAVRILSLASTSHKPYEATINTAVIGAQRADHDLGTVMQSMRMFLDYSVRLSSCDKAARTLSLASTSHTPSDAMTT